MFRSWPAFLLTALLITSALPFVWGLEPGAGSRPASDRSLPPRTDRYGDPLPPGALARLGTVHLRLHSIQAAAWSPNGKLLAAASNSKYSGIRLWEVATGKEVRRMGRGVEHSVLAWSPDGKILASGHLTRSPITIWDVATGKIIRQLPGPKDHLLKVLAWSPDNKTLASGGGDQTVRLWDVPTGKQRHRLTGHTDWLHALAWSPDGKLLASAADKTIHLWDTTTGKELRRINEHKDWVRSLTWSPNGKVLASAGDAIVRFWEPQTGKALQTVAQGSSVRWSPDGRMLACKDGDGMTRLLDAETGEELRRIPADCVLWSPDSKALASLQCSTIRLWDADMGTRIRAWDGHEGLVSSVCWSPDGKRVASASWDETVRIWDPTSATVIHTLTGHQSFVTAVAWSPDGKTLASGSLDDTIRLWSATSGKKVRQLTGHKRNVISLAWSPSGQVLASGSEDRTIRLWDAVAGKEILRLASTIGEIPTLAWSPDGKRLAAAGRDYSLPPARSNDNAVCVWNTATGKEVHRLIHPDRAAAVAWPPNGEILASSSGQAIHLWATATGQEMRRLGAAGGWPRSLAWSPDGKLLATAADKMVRVLEVVTGMEVHRFTGHDDWVESVAWSPDGTRLASGSADTTLLIWAIPNHQGDPPLRLALPKLQSSWADLAGVDPARVRSALRMLTRGAQGSIRFLAGQLKPIPAADPRTTARLIDDLDSDRYAARQQAMSELEALREHAEPALQRALANRPSLETRMRLERLLKQQYQWSSEQVRGQRAITVLEAIGTPEARVILKVLAQGAPEARLTQEATASLERLARRRNESAPSPR